MKTQWHHGFLDPTKTRFFSWGQSLQVRYLSASCYRSFGQDQERRPITEESLFFYHYHRRISRTRCRPRRLRRSLNPGLCLVLMLIIYHLTIYANTRPLLLEATPLQYCPLTDVWGRAHTSVTQLQRAVLQRILPASPRQWINMLHTFSPHDLSVQSCTR